MFNQIFFSFIALAWIPQKAAGNKQLIMNLDTDMLILIINKLIIRLAEKDTTMQLLHVEPVQDVCWSINLSFYIHS